MMIRHAEGFVAGATPLLTGTLSGHPSNRTVYSGLKLPALSSTQTGAHGMGPGGSRVRKNGEWER